MKLTTSAVSIVLIWCMLDFPLNVAIFVASASSASWRSNVVDMNENQQQNIRHGRSRSHIARMNRRVFEQSSHFVENYLDKRAKTRSFSAINAFDFVASNSEYNLSSAETIDDSRQTADSVTPTILLNKTTSLKPQLPSKTQRLTAKEADSTSAITESAQSTSNITDYEYVKNIIFNIGAENDQDQDQGDANDADLTDSVDPEKSFSTEDNVTQQLKHGEAVNARSGHGDIVTKFLRIVESQHSLGENCTAGTDWHLGEGVVDRYAQERFRVEADVAVNRANMLTRLWKYADPSVVMSEYLLHASVFSMVEFDDDIFAAGNCYDQYQYKDYLLFCPYAYRLPEGPILVKDLAVEYKYLSNTSEWFYIARKNAENVIRNYNQFSRGYNTYTWNESAHTERIPDEILSVTYEDGKWSKPYYDCGGGNIWMLTYTVPFFGFQNNSYYFKGTSGIDIDLRRVDIDQCPLPKGSTQLNIFAASDKCKKRTTECVPLPGLGFRRGSYKCVCRHGFYFPNVTAERRYYNGTVIEEEYEKLMLGEENQYSTEGMFECLPCPEGCESCEDDRPCVVSLNWVMRTAILILSCVAICCLPIVVLFTWKYGNVKVVRAASPVLLRVITLGAFFIYSTTIVMYPKPTVYTCTARVWLREIGFALTYGALMLKTWRISVIFRVRSAKAVKITDLNLMKRLGVIVAVFSVLLVIRTLVAPPLVIVGRTADDLKAYLCRTDWWDHSFTTMEVLFLVWGIRLCIVVRKAPSEFNESRFISMAIYNEFLLSLFLNISMLFLQSPANPDLLYIIFFCHTQLTVTLLLCLIFGSKAYMVFRGTDKTEESSGMMSKSQATKFLSKPRSGNSQYTSTNSSAAGLEYAKFTDQDVQEEFRRLYTQLELLKEKNMRFGNRHLAAKISAMQDAATRLDCQWHGHPKPPELTSSSKEESQPESCESDSPHVKLNNVSCTPLLRSLPKPMIDNRDITTIPDACSMCGKRGATVSPITEEEKDIIARLTSPVVEELPHKIDENIEQQQSVVSVNNMPIDAIAVLKCTSPTPSNVSSKESANGGNENGVETGCSRVGQGYKVTGGGGGGSNSSSTNTNANASASAGASASNRLIKSGHARTHAIVINLDDKSRFTEEVTV